MHLADSLVNLLHCDAKVAFDAIQTSNEIVNGDLVVILPRLKLQNRSAHLKEQCFELIQQVGEFHILVLWHLTLPPRNLAPFCFHVILIPWFHRIPQANH